MTELETLKQRVQELEQKLGVGRYDPIHKGYEVLVNILGQQNEYLSEFKIKNKIGGEEKSDQITYKNAKDLWENLPLMIEKVSMIKKILQVDEKKEDAVEIISAKRIAEGDV